MRRHRRVTEGPANTSWPKPATGAPTLHHLAWGRHGLAVCGAVKVRTITSYDYTTCPRCAEIIVRNDYRSRYPDGPLCGTVGALTREPRS